MFTKTSFKRVALAVVVALGFGLLTTAPAANAAIVGQTLTLGASTATVTAGESVTVGVTLAFTPTALQDSVTVKSSCVAPVGASCPSSPSGLFYWTPTTDSAATVTQLRTAAGGTSANGYITSYSMSSSTAANAVSATVNFKMVTTSSTTAGTYTFTVYTESSAAGATAAATSADKSATWTVTVTAANTAPTQVRSFITTDAATANYWMTRSATQSSKDSAVVVDRGTLTSTNLTQVAVIGIQALNSAGETRTATQSLNICSTGCAITASISGVGALAAGTGATVARTSAVQSIAMVVYNNDYSVTSGSAALETISVYSTGTAGTGTVTFYNGAVSIGSVSVTFTGAPASAAISLSDTTVAVGQSSVVIKGYVKDSAGTLYSNTGKSLYVYASDTKVVTGALSTDSAQFTQRAAGLAGAATACSYDATLGYFNCALTIADTGTATITLRDSWTVAASSFVSNEVVLTALGVVAKSYTVAFDKATYAPGERATITITGLDAAGRAVSNGANGAGLTVTMLDTPSLGTSPKAGTNAAGTASAGTFKGYVTDLGVETGIETRVVTMPTYGGDVTFEITYTPVLSTTAITVSANAKVVDPNATAIAANNAAIAAAQAANNAAIAAAQAASVAAAEAATDAAAEAIDAANAATDAANLAAEAADAATVAAEEARDAADAATAAVEELAT